MCCIYRIDDAAPGMNWANFNRFIELFKKYRVVPLVGVVPDNKDPNLTVQKEEPRFWDIIKKLKDDGIIEVSQHGYQHKYTTKLIQPFQRFCGFKPQSEFYGLSYRRQYEMLKAGKSIFAQHGIKVDVFMSPGHSFDSNTKKALKALEFRAVTDGIGLYPVRSDGLIFIPQQKWSPVKSGVGVKTICLHLNSVDDSLYRKVEEHLRSDKNIVPFSSALKYEAKGYHLLANSLYKGAFVLGLARNQLRNTLESILK